MIMNKYGDNRSPCQRPRLCLIHGPRMPLSLTEDDDEDNSKHSQSCHLARNPLCCSRSSRYCQETELNAFEISCFISKADVFFLWQALARFLTHR
jgi:hypothetical protein